MSKTPLPSFTAWSSFPFEGDLRVKRLDDPVDVEPPRRGEDAADCAKCQTPDEAYIWVNENWRVRAMDRPGGLPMVLILESRSHLDLGDLTNMLAAELGVMTVRLERAVRSMDGVARVHVNRWGDGAAHLHLWFMARPHGRLQLRGTFLSLWDEILPPVPEPQWRENLALIAAWLAEFGGTPLAEPPHIDWKAPASLAASNAAQAAAAAAQAAATASGGGQASGASAADKPAQPSAGQTGRSTAGPPAGPAGPAAGPAARPADTTTAAAAGAGKTAAAGAVTGAGRSAGAGMGTAAGPGRNDIGPNRQRATAEQGGA